MNGSRITGDGKMGTFDRVLKKLKNKAPHENRSIFYMCTGSEG